MSQWHWTSMSMEETKVAISWSEFLRKMWIQGMIFIDRQSLYIFITCISDLGVFKLVFFRSIKIISQSKYKSHLTLHKRIHDGTALKCDFKDCHNVRMLKIGGCLSFCEESSKLLRWSELPRQNHFESYQSVKWQLSGQVNDSHSSPRDLAN